MLQRDHQEIRLYIPFMNFIQDHMRKPVQNVLIIHDLLQQDPIRHVQDPRIRRDLLLHPDLITNEIAQIAAQLHWHSLRKVYRCHSTWLRADYIKLTQTFTPRWVLLVQKFRNLRTFAAPRLPWNYHNF